VINLQQPVVSPSPAAHNNRHYGAHSIIYKGDSIFKLSSLHCSPPRNKSFIVAARNGVLPPTLAAMPLADDGESRMNFRNLKTGNEPLTFGGKPVGFALSEFWQWSVSDLMSNVTRGRLAEFIVATSLRIDLSRIRDEWQAFDLLTPEGVKVEVKSAAFVQSWNQKKPSSISFSTRATRYWDSETNVQAKVPKRQADVYVFCLLKHVDKATIDPLDLDQWEFYVLSTRELNSYKRSQHSITLNSLRRLSLPVTYENIRKKVISKSPQKRGTAANKRQHGARTLDRRRTFKIG
jgi:hypothetical protein